MQAYIITKCEIEGTSLHLWLDIKNKMFNCPQCERLIFSTHGNWESILHELPILGYHTILHIRNYRVRCSHCRIIFSVQSGTQHIGFRVTQSLANAIITGAKEVPLQFIAELYGVNWNTARDIDYAYLKERIDSIEPVAPNSIGVDEIAYKKGHKYLTIVNDLTNHKTIFVTKGRKKENLAEFFEERIDPGAKRWLEAASIDMWKPYETTLQHYTPQAVIIYDKFHIFRMLNDCVDTVRRQEQKHLEQQGISFLKNNRFILLKKQESLRPEEQQTLASIMQLNEPLQKAYILKEQFRVLYTIDSENTKTDAELVQRAFQLLVGWLQRAIESKLKPFIDFAKRIKKRYMGILNYFRYPINNGLSEGLNNKIASLIKRAYGYRNTEYFILKIYQQGNFI